MNLRYISTDPDIRAAIIQAYIKKTEENAIKELIEFLEYRTDEKTQKKRKAKPDEQRADLNKAVNYLSQSQQLPSPYTPLIDNLAKQIKKAQKHEQISLQDAPLITELIYRVVSHAKQHSTSEKLNLVNARRGVELAVHIAENPKWKMVRGICLCLFGLALTAAGVASLVATLGGSIIPLSASLIAFGLLGTGHGRRQAKEGQKEKSRHIGTAAQATDSENEPLTGFFKPRTPSMPSPQSEKNIYVEPGNDYEESHDRDRSWTWAVYPPSPRNSQVGSPVASSAFFQPPNRVLESGSISNRERISIGNDNDNRDRALSDFDVDKRPVQLSGDSVTSPLRKSL